MNEKPPSKIKEERDRVLLALLNGEKPHTYRDEVLAPLARADLIHIVKRHRRGTAKTLKLTIGGEVVANKIRNEKAKKEEEERKAKLEDKATKAILRMCNFIIGLQESGKHVPGHNPRSGVFADCSMACEMNHPPCLSVVAYKLRKQLQDGNISIQKKV